MLLISTVVGLGLVYLMSFVEVCGSGSSTFVSIGEVYAPESLDDVKSKLADGTAVLLDVRTTKEWDEGHLESAIHAPFEEMKGQEYSYFVAERMGAAGVIYTHCGAGPRAKRAANRLKKFGFVDVRPLDQGYEELLTAGFARAIAEGETSTGSWDSLGP